MEVNAPNSGRVAVDGIGRSVPSSAPSEPAHTGQSSSAEVQTDHRSVGAGVADATSTPSQQKAADVDGKVVNWRGPFREIAEIIKSFTEPCKGVNKWQFLEDDARLRIDIAPAEFVEAMEQEFGAEAVTELGLCERVEDELVLPSWLDGDGPFYVTIDMDRRTLCFESDSEFLFPMARTALNYARERLAHESIQEPVTLYVGESQDAVEIMQRLGLRAVRCEGLEAFGREDVQRLFSREQRSDFGWRYYLLLMDFDVARLENRPTAVIGEVLKRLADAADVYGIDPAHRFGVCRPGAREFKELELAITFEDSAQIRQLFERWAAAARDVRINSWRTHFETEVASFSAAREALISALQHSNGLVRRAEVLVALPAYRVAGKAAVIQKFHQTIDSASDPFDQIDLIAATGYAESFLDSDPLVRAGELVLDGQTPPSIRELEEELFEQRQRCMVELRRIRRDRKTKR